MSEFVPKIVTDISGMPEVIETNLGALESIIKEREDFAASLVVQETDIEFADKTASKMKKVAERLKRFRLDDLAVRNPYEQAEAMCKGYEKRLTACADILREKTEVFKVAARAKRAAELKAVFDKLLTDFRSQGDKCLEHFENFFAVKTCESTKGNWLLKSAKDDAIHAEMEAEVERCTEAAKCIESYFRCSPYAAKQAAKEYLFTHDFDVIAATTEGNRVKELIAEQERRKAESPAPAQAAEPTAPAEPQKVLATERVDLYTFRLAVTGTMVSLKRFKVWCGENGITLKNLDK